jgi:hypothetical protein
MLLPRNLEYVQHVEPLSYLLCLVHLLVYIHLDEAHPDHSARITT